MNDAESLSGALAAHLPQVLRWAGAVARTLREFNVAVGQKSSGNANTDALTLADLSVQELLVAALRDSDSRFLHCRLEAEESTGDLHRFARQAPYTIALDPIDGTKQYRDHTGDGYGVMLHLRSSEAVLYSLCYLPQRGRYGTWVEARDGQVVCGEDDPARPAAEVLQSLEPIDPRRRPRSKNIYLIGFQSRDRDKARQVSEAGLSGYAPEEMPGSIYELLATGEFGGSLIHSPNVYDFPVAVHIARLLGGDALWVQNRQPVHFQEVWDDRRADMLRLPGIVACSPHRDILASLCNLARQWNPVRYAEE